MIERKDIRHDYTGSHVVGCDKLSSGLMLTIELTVERKEVVLARFNLIDKLRRDNEEAIRRKLYGDVVDELKIMQDFAERCEQSVEQLILVGRFYDLIDKLEWRDTDGTR